MPYIPTYSKNINIACIVYTLLHTMACCYVISRYVISDIAGTTFLYKQVPNVQLQKSIKFTSNVKYVIKTTNSCSIYLWRTHSLFLVGISDSSSGLIRYPYEKTTHMFFTDISNTHLFLL